MLEEVISLSKVIIAFLWCLALYLVFDYHIRPQALKKHFSRFTNVCISDSQSKAKRSKTSRKLKTKDEPWDDAFKKYDVEVSFIGKTWYVSTMSIEASQQAENYVGSSLDRLLQSQVLKNLCPYALVHNSNSDKIEKRKKFLSKAISNKSCQQYIPKMEKFLKDAGVGKINENEIHRLVFGMLVAAIFGDGVQHIFDEVLEYDQQGWPGLLGTFDTKFKIKIAHKKAREVIKKWVYETKDEDWLFSHVMIDSEDSKDIIFDDLLSFLLLGSQKVSDAVNLYLKYINKTTWDNFSNWIQEWLRIEPVLNTSLSYYVHDEIEIWGVKIPNGWILTKNIKSIHHDPNQWQEASKYIPERFDVTSTYFTRPENKSRTLHSFCPFLWGKRSCPGEALTISCMVTLLPHLAHSK